MDEEAQITPLYVWPEDMREVHKEFIDQVVRPGIRGRKDIPKMVVTPRRYLKAFGSKDGILEGFTEEFRIKDSKGSRTVAIAFVPRGARTSVRLHELGHVIDWEGKPAGRAPVTLKEFIGRELRATAWALSKKERLLGFSSVADIALQAMHTFGNSPKTVVREIDRQLRPLGFNLKREDREALIELLEDNR